MQTKKKKKRRIEGCRFKLLGILCNKKLIPPIYSVVLLSEVEIHAHIIFGIYFTSPECESQLLRSCLAPLFLDYVCRCTHELLGVFLLCLPSHTHTHTHPADTSTETKQGRDYWSWWVNNLWQRELKLSREQFLYPNQCWYTMTLFSHLWNLLL